MGILPMEFVNGESAASLGMTGHESFDILGLPGAIASDFGAGKILTVVATGTDGTVKTFEVKARIDTPLEVQYYQHSGILQYVLRSLL